MQEISGHLPGFTKNYYNSYESACREPGEELKNVAS